MKRRLIYTADRGQALNLQDLRAVLDDADQLKVYRYGAVPVVRVDPARPGQTVGTIREIRIEG